MLRIQACITSLVLVALRSSEGFSTAQQPLSSPRSFTSKTNCRSPGSRQRRSLTTSSTSANLFSSQFRFNEHDKPSPNGRIENRHSSKDFWYNIKTLPSSTILRDVRKPVLAVLGWSTFISVVHFVLQRSSSALMQSVASSMCISSSAHSFLVSALGLLLVFRTNSAYQRFYEGRKIWEQILSVSRNLSRLTHLYGREIGQARQQRLRQLIAAYPYLLRHHIRSGCLCSNAEVDHAHRLLLTEPTYQMVETRHEGDKNCGGSTSTTISKTTTIPSKKDCWVDRRNLPWSLLTPGALQKVARAKNRPLWICNRLGREICDIPYNDHFSNRERQHFLSQVEKLTNAIGQCERIHQTAVPLNYARHSLRSLTIWLFTLPFALIPQMGIMTGPATAIIAWLMFGVYEIGYSIEDPFQGSLRLSILCDAIRTDVLNMDNDDDGDLEQDESWMLDGVAQNTLKTHILDAAQLASVGKNNSLLPLISPQDYQELEK